MKNKITWLIVVLLLAVGAAYWRFKPAAAPAGDAASHGGGKPGMGGPSGPDGMGGGMTNRPFPVQAQAARRGDMEVTINALGTVSARNTAIVKARVAGQLQRIAFREGQLVKQGDLLAEIDPRPFQAQLDQAAGQLARDEALLANARADLERYRNLLKKDSIASQQVDNQDWLVRQYEGTVKNDRGIVADAKLQLDFSRVTAPFSGRLGLRQVDVGNYVQTSDANGIVVITQTRPINVVFAIPADTLPAVLAHPHAGEPLPVDAYDRVGATRLATGKVVSIDNQMDVATGTVKLKAEFANSDEKLFPNQFVNARLHVDTRHDVVLAPTAAIQRGARGLFMYVVGADKTVHVRAVTPGPTSHDSVVIENGLREGELVVIDGADKLRDGAKVEISQPGAGKAPANIPGRRAARQSAQ